jgi:hypothetical protein
MLNGITLTVSGNVERLDTAGSRVKGQQDLPVGGQ